MSRQRAMTVANTYGKAHSGVLLMNHGRFRHKKKPHYCEVSRNGEFRIHSGGDNTYDVQTLIKLKDIHSVGLAQGKDAVFVICCPEGSFRMFAESPESAEHWVFALNPPLSKGDDESGSNTKESGWLVINKKKCYVELRKTSLIMFERQGGDDPFGAITLDALCTLVPPKPVDEQSRVTFHINTAGRQWTLTSKTQADVDRWISSIQDVIETAPTLTTRFEKYVTQNQHSDPFTMDEVYMERGVLCFGDESLDSPLTPLPYGKIGKAASGNEYGYLHVEAISLFDSFIPDGESRFGNVTMGEKWIRNILSVGFDLPQMRNEIFCQAMKQVSKIPDVYARYAINYWKLLAALCAHFIPSAKFLNYLRSVLHHAAQHNKHIAIIRSCANYCLTLVQSPVARPCVDEDLLAGIVSGTAFASTEANSLVLDTKVDDDEEA